TSTILRLPTLDSGRCERRSFFMAIGFRQAARWEKPRAHVIRRPLMLDLFRKRGLSSVVYGVIIVATATVFVIQFRPNAGQKAASIKEACVAKVRGWCIDPKDHRAAYRILIPRDAQGGLLTAKAKS